MGDILFIGGDRRMICAASLSRRAAEYARSGWAAISLSLKTSRADMSG